MNKLSTIVAMSALAFTFAVPAVAQTAAPAGIATVAMADHSLRTSKLIGAAVFNDQGDNIGTIADIVIRPTGGEPDAILSVGGYLGVGNKLIAVPLSHVKLEGNSRMMMAGATKQMLFGMPVFLFAPNENNNG